MSRLVSRCVAVEVERDYGPSLAWIDVELVGEGFHDEVTSSATREMGSQIRLPPSPVADTGDEPRSAPDQLDGDDLGRVTVTAMVDGVGDSLADC